MKRCDECGAVLKTDNSSICRICGRQLYLDKSDGETRYSVTFSREVQKHPFLSSLPYIAPRLFIDGEEAYIFTKCEEVTFYLNEGIHNFDIKVYMSERGVRLELNIHRNMTISFRFLCLNGPIIRFTYD